MKAKKLSELLEFRKERTKEALKLAQYGLWEEAEEINRQIVELLSGDHIAHSRLADSLMRQGRELEAAEHYQVATGLEKAKNDRNKKAVKLAMQSSWKDAAEVNEIFIEDCCWDMEAFNRLGKALMELGKNKKAAEAFRCALVISPNSAIASKNLARLEKVSSVKNGSPVKVGVSARTFIEESGKTGVTKLVNIPRGTDLTYLVAGHSVDLVLSEKGIRVKDELSSEIGSLEPKIGIRLHRLIKGGNRYEASITSVLKDAVSLIIHETYRDPTQATTRSFSSKADGLPTIPNGSIGYSINDAGKLADLKDWSSDDTESGDEEVFSPMIPRLISGDSSINEEDY